MNAHNRSGTAALLFALTLSAGAWSAARAEFNITITGLEGTAYRTYFDQAAAFWEGAITGYANYDAGDVTISASMEDLASGTLGQAGPSAGVFHFTSKTLYATTGLMQFNTDYYSESSVATFSQAFYDVVCHEMGHVLGLGTLWNYEYSGINYNAVLDPGDPLKYIGEHALANYRSEFNQPGALWVPLEDQGGSGTAGAHWDETYGGASDTGFISAITGMDMRYELMTGWANSPMFLSSVTLGALEDLGYIVNYGVLNTVPESAAYAVLAGLAMLVYVALRRRIKH